MRGYRVLMPTLVLLTATSTAALSQAQPAPSEAAQVVLASTAGMKQSFAPIVKRAAPAVVNVSSKKTVRQADPFWQQFGIVVPRNRVEGSLGSGVIVRSDGVIVTNNHVIANGGDITRGPFRSPRIPGPCVARRRAN